MIYRSFIGVGLLLGLTINGNAMGSNVDRFIDTPSQFTGFITQIQPGGSKDVPGWIHVESHADKLVHRHTVTITNKTRIFVRKDGSYHPAGFEVFQTKHWVKIWFAEPIKDSNSKNTIALQVEVINRP